MAVVCASTGCDKLFSLQHLDESPTTDGKTVDGVQIDAGIPPDASCGMTGMAMTVMLGARTGGPGQASMIDTFVVDAPSSKRNYGAAPTLGLCELCAAPGSPWDQSRAVSLLRFDTTAICPGSTITAARLFLDTTDDNLGSGAVGVFVVREAWTEGGGPAEGVEGAANWTQRTVSSAWSVAGVGAPGSRDAVAVATFMPTTKNSSYSVPIPSAVLQAWLANTASNHGLALAITSGSSDAQFYSRDGGTAAQRPGLAVDILLP